MPFNFSTSLFLLSEEERATAARFLARLNPLPEHQICYLGTDELEIASELSTALPPEGYSLGAQDEAGNLVGFLGVEMDPSLGRAWLFGPFVEMADWHGLADRLYQAALERLPAEIVDQELFGRPEHARLAEFAQRHGFKAGTPAALLALPRPAQGESRPGGGGQKVQVAQDETGGEPDGVQVPAVAGSDSLARQLESLHNQLFPNTYYDAAQLISMSAEVDKRLQIEVVEGQVAGYIFLQARPASKEAFIDFLGVAEPYRRRGIARRLLAGAADWAFARPFVDRVTLAVHSTNTAAMALYENAGFETVNIMVGYRKRP